MKLITVGISDLAVGRKETKIRTSGLGSCIGIIIYDEKTKVGGLSHIMLPKAYGKEGEVLEKYADTALPILYKKMVKEGASISRMKAALFGGAEMFKMSKKIPQLSIGDRNADSCREELNKLGVEIVYEDVGGSKGRTIEIDCSSGEVNVRTVGSDEYTFKF